MFEKIINWIRGAKSPKNAGVRARPQKALYDRHKSENRRKTADRRKKSEYVELDPETADSLKNSESGHNVLIRNKYQREDTDTHDNLKIIDDSMIDSGEETGIDPYNTGNFDRSRNWDKRFRK